MSSEGKIVSSASNKIRENGTGSGVTYGNFETGVRTSGTC